MTDPKRLFKTNLLLVLLVVVIGAVPFLIHPPGAEFAGSDDQVSTVLEQDHPDYLVWFQPLWEPPSEEIESLLFALQAAIGAGIGGYVLGYLKGRKNTRNDSGGLIKLEKDGIS